MTGSIKAFARAVWLGALTGGGPFLLLTVPLAIATFSQDRWSDTLFVAPLPVLIAGAVVLAAMVLFGLPLTAWLTRQYSETVQAYATFGISLGIAIPFVVFTAMESVGAGMFFAVPGAFAGFVAARSWGRWREQVCEAAAAEFA